VRRSSPTLRLVPGPASESDEPGLRRRVLSLTVQQLWKAAAVLFSALAAVAGLLFLRLKWVPGVDFDVTGFFWLVRNAGRLSLLTICIICAAAAVSFWIRVYVAGE